MAAEFLWNMENGECCVPASGYKIQEKEQRGLLQNEQSAHKKEKKNEQKRATSTSKKKYICAVSELV